ncbi:MAG: hypothetical protein JWM16_5983 [Verrucomicrobiales bacterium]|nr:hypothetical protein [Verrucomicrobiales bacterium]
MKARTYIIVFCLLLSVPLSLWVARSYKSKPTEVGPEFPEEAETLTSASNQMSRDNLSPSGKKAETSSLQRGSTAGSGNTEKKAPGEKLEAEAAAERIKPWLQQVHRPISFYGKVLDEKGLPIPSANVELHYNQVHPERTIGTNLTTDTEGLFAFQGGEGSTLGVQVSKEGYYPITRSNRTSFVYTPLLDPNPFSPDPNNPVKFYLKKRGPGVDLITSAFGVNADFRVQAPLDGTPIVVNLLERKVGVAGQLVIRQQKPEYSKIKSATEWSFMMEIADGGFVEHDDEFPIEAPESGYQKSVSFRFVRVEPGWRTFINKQYYIAFGNPKRFGTLSLDTRIGMDGARLQYIINPDGSRYLEGKEYREPTRVLPPGVTETRP